MKNLKGKPFALLIFILFSICFILKVCLSGKPLSHVWSVLGVAYGTIPLMLLLGAGFVLHAWKWCIFRGWLVPFPNLNGTWQGIIQTTWKNPETGQGPGSIPIILTIRQSFVRISCVMRTAEMTSRSFLADFWLDGDEQIRMLGYSYHSSPLPSVKSRSQAHDGTIILELIGNPVEKIKGKYWTDRQTTGEVTLTFREKKRLEELPLDLGKHPVSRK